MPIDPFAAVSALRSLQSYLDKMTREFSEKRKLLDGAITSVLFAWDCGFPAVAIAPLLDKARSAIATECPPVSASATGLEYDIAHILLTACENDTLTLLTQLFNVYPAEVVAVRHALARHAGRVLAAWCVRHADDYPARLRAEAQRLGITGSAFSEWCEKPQADEVAGVLVFATAYGRTFEVGLIYDTPDLGAVAAVEGDPVRQPDPGPVEAKPRRPAGETNSLVRDYLTKHARANLYGMTVRGIAHATGASVGGVAKSAAWKAFKEERQKSRPGSIKTVRLTHGMLAAVSNRDSELARLIADQEADDRGDEDDEAPQRR